MKKFTISALALLVAFVLLISGTWAQKVVVAKKVTSKNLIAYNRTTGVAKVAKHASDIRTDKKQLRKTYFKEETKSFKNNTVAFVPPVKKTEKTNTASLKLAAVKASDILVISKISEKNLVTLTGTAVLVAVDTTVKTKAKAAPQKTAAKVIKAQPKPKAVPAIKTEPAAGAKAPEAAAKASETPAAPAAKAVDTAAPKAESTGTAQTEPRKIPELPINRSSNPLVKPTSGSQLPTEDEGARITAIEIRGNEHVTTEEILAGIRSKVGDPLLEPRLRSDVQAVYDMGYFTDVKVDTPYYAGGIKLVFRIQENPLVKKITILGNKLVPTEKLQELIQTKEGKILNMKVLNADMNEINYYYDETLGYLLKPTHIKNVNWTTDGELVLTVQEGMPVTKVEICGSSLYKEEKLRCLVKLKPGVLFNTREVKEDSQSISNFYEEQGFVLDTVRPQVNYKEGIITFQVIEAVLEDIRIEWDNPKHKTKEYVVCRNIRLQKGKVIERKKLQRDIERLNNTGFFSKVNVEPEPGSKPGCTVLVFRLKEQKTGLASIGAGYSGGGSGALRSGITGMLSWSEKNLGGTGQSASAGWQRGVNIDVLSLSYYNPAINCNLDSFGVSLFRHKYTELRQPLYNPADPENPLYALYDDSRYGGAVTYGRRITDDFRAFLSYRREVMNITKNPKSQYEPFGLSKGTLSAVNLGILLDDRNDIFDPSEGNYIDASYVVAGKFIGGTYTFNKAQAELRKYIPVGKKKRSTIALRAWGGSVFGGNSPITETFYVGGTDTIRGYNENVFYGTRMVVLNAEYRFPLANVKFLKGTVFADAGNAWFPSQSNSKKLYTDYGVGLRIVFPTLGLGVIRLDYARGENGGRTSIGIGQTF